jgi:hypothetical protein
MSHFERERRERNQTQNTERTEIEQRKNKETRRICSLIIGRQIRQIRHLKKGNLFALDILIYLSSFQMF